jgi:hypothetical protein
MIGAPPPPAGIIGPAFVVTGGAGLAVGAALSQPDSPTQAAKAPVDRIDAVVIRFEKGIVPVLSEKNCDVVASCRLVAIRDEERDY